MRLFNLPGMFFKSRINLFFVFRTERSSDNPLPIVIPDINFEICCVMFNIGCLHALIAATQQRNDEDVWRFDNL